LGRELGCLELQPTLMPALLVCHVDLHYLAGSCQACYKHASQACIGALGAW
jgi:hypothetical protein